MKLQHSKAAYRWEVVQMVDTEGYNIITLVR